MAVQPGYCMTWSNTPNIFSRDGTDIYSRYFGFYTQMMTNVLLATAHHQQHVPILRVDLTARARVDIYKQDQEHAKVSVYFKLETMSVNLPT